MIERFSSSHVLEQLLQVGGSHAPAGITITETMTIAGSAEAVDAEVEEWSLTLASGVRRHFESITMAKFGWSVIPGSPTFETLRGDEWFQTHYPPDEYGESFLVEECLSGWIDLSDLGSMVLNHNDGELDIPLSMCTIDGAKVDPAQFYCFDSHYNLRALLRAGGEGIDDAVWLLHQGDDPWLKPMGVSLARYVECAWSVRGLRGWQLALLGDSMTRERITAVVPRCFPDATPDFVLG